MSIDAISMGEYERTRDRLIEAEAQIAALEARLKAAEWQPITPENLPKVGDEVAHWWELGQCWLVREWSSGDGVGKETLFRAISAPPK
jgi:hypothetical protein